MTRRLLPAALLAIAATAAVPGAQADVGLPSIVVQKSIRGVSLGDSEAVVRTKLGKPTSAKTDEVGGDFGTFVTLKYPKLVVRLKGDGSKPKVYEVTTTRKTDQTKQGAGPGSTGEFVDENVPRTNCDEHYCLVGQPVAGKKQTQFLLNGKGTVRAVSLIKPIPGA